MIVDLCTGSGALAVALAAPGPAPGSSPSTTPPTRWRTRGATRAAPLSNSSRRTSPHPDLLAELDGTVDLIVANPPYIPDGAQLEPEVAEHDPPHALFGGPDGMAVITPIVELAGAAASRPAVAVAVEHDDTTSAPTVDAVRRGRRSTTSCARRDLAGRPRFVTATRGR